jgi:parallel beta-helix repeat protein
MAMRWSTIVLCMALVVVLGTRTAGRQPRRSASPRGYYVSATAQPGGLGSMDQPWSLATALGGANGSLQPGDTVWLRGGTYQGAFRTALEGTPGQWIVFRQYPGERATIDGTLRAEGAYLAFWGFEIMQSTPSTYGLEANTKHGRFINLVVHDAGTEGISFWTPGVDGELYGCIVYNNGTHENHDHGVYVHNEAGTKVLADNVFFNNLAAGIQVYASHKNPVIRNVRIEGNVAFNNGSISSTVPAHSNLIVNAQVPTEGMVAIGNLLYFSGADGVNLSLGTYASANNRDITVQDNYVVGGRIGLQMVEPWQRALVTGNTFVGGRDLVDVGGAGLDRSYTWSANTWVGDSSAPSWRFDRRRYGWNAWRQASGLGETDRMVTGPPRQTRVFVRPNRYERGRAHLVIFNWGRRAEVPVDVSQVLRPGDRYEVRSVQALFGPPLVSGVSHGDSILVPMDGVIPPEPVGRPSRHAPQTGPVFDVFLLTSRSP